MKTDFYEQYEFSLLHTTLPPTVSPLVTPEAIGAVRRLVTANFNVVLDDRTTLIAHKLVSGQRIAIHNDYLTGQETHRLVVQLNRGLRAEAGGFFLLFNSFDPRDVHRVIRPVSRSGLGFAISAASNHAVSRLYEGRALYASVLLLCRGSHSWNVNCRSSSRSPSRNLTPRGSPRSLRPWQQTLGKGSPVTDLLPETTARIAGCTVTRLPRDHCTQSSIWARHMSAPSRFFRPPPELDTRNSAWHSPHEAAPTPVFPALESALASIALVPDLYATVATYMRALHLLRAPSADFDVSHSDPEVPFSIFVSIPPIGRDQTWRLAESIVHECMHLHLTMIETTLPLVDDQHVLVFSPWQRRARPLRGVLHGLYVSSVIDAYFRVLEETETVTPEDAAILKKRRHAIANETTAVADLADNTGLTGAGRAIVMSLLGSVRPNKLGVAQEGSSQGAEGC